MPPHIFNQRFFDKGDYVKRILITRPEPGASETASRVTALGMVPIVAPVLSIVPQAIDPPRIWSATVLTSRNAVKVCPPSMWNHPVFAVGTATATEATSAGFTHVVNADGDASALTDLIANTLSPRDGTLVLPVAKGQGLRLASALRHRGFRVLRRVAYRSARVETLPAAAASALAGRKVALAMFFSSETSQQFVNLLQAANLIDAVRNAEAVSISERAAVPLRALPWRRIQVATKPNQDAMLALLQ